MAATKRWHSTRFGGHLCLILMLALVSPKERGEAQPAEVADPGSRVRSLLSKEQSLLATDAGGLWGKHLENVPLLLVQNERVFATADPKMQGYALRNGFWCGPLPKTIAPENMTIEWAGHDWAMINLPLPEDDDAAIRTLIHESWHVVQPAVLPLPTFDDATSGSRLLDEVDGRLWLQLEWRALASALKATDLATQTRGIVSALLFRQKRLSLATVGERERERLLDQWEGLAEYTAWKLSNANPRELALKLTDEAPSRPSFIRSFPYYTGPAYAFLLDQRLPHWLEQLKRTQNLQALIGSTLSADEQRTTTNLEATEQVARAFGLEELRSQERARWLAQRQRLQALKAQFIDGPTLRIRPAQLHVTYDPREQLSLGDNGSVMTTVRWKTEDGGDLQAARALVTPNWKEIWLPISSVRLTSTRLAKPIRIEQRDWVLTLPAGWRLEQHGQAWVAVP